MSTLPPPLDDSLLWRLLYGCLVTANLAMPVRLRYELLVGHRWIDLTALDAYQSFGYTLALLLGFVAAFLPFLLPWAAAVGLGLGTVATVAVDRIEDRTYRRKPRAHGT